MSKTTDAVIDQMNTAFEPAFVPYFSRLSDHCGLWCLEPMFAAGLWRFALSPELRPHMELAPPEPKCAVDLVQTPGGTIADIKLQGVMMKAQSSMGNSTSTILARREIRKASFDDQIAGIMLSIDSPGGTVSGTSDLAADVRAATKEKPVWAYAEDMTASAAYWTASQANKIYANADTALIGSIGTIQVVHDLSGAAEKEGVKTLVFATGALKGTGAPGSKITDEQSSYLQSMVNGMQESFDAAVKSGRNLSDEQLKAVRHGGVMRAKDALSAKLIDGIASRDKVLSDFARHLKSPSRFMQNASINEVSARGGLPMKRSGLPTIQVSRD